MAAQPRRLGGPSPKLSSRVSDKFDRTKEAAAAGMEKTKEVASVGVEKTKVAAKKVKQGASTSVNWLKIKYSKSFQKK
ncbi:hypothetical protein ACS0TY_001416 [Phlomoides rotata]